MTASVASFRHLLGRLDSAAFETQVYTASSPRLAAVFASEDPIIHEASARLRQHRSLAREVLVELSTLASMDVDQRYASPHDAALLGLLLVLQAGAPRSASVGAQLVLDAPRAFVARHAAVEILGEGESGRVSEHAGMPQASPFVLVHGDSDPSFRSDSRSNQVNESRPMARIVRASRGLEFLVPQDDADGHDSKSINIGVMHNDLFDAAFSTQTQARMAEDSGTSPASPWELCGSESRS